MREVHCDICNRVLPFDRKGRDFKDLCLDINFQIRGKNIKSDYHSADICMKCYPRLAKFIHDKIKKEANL